MSSSRPRLESSCPLCLLPQWQFLWLFSLLMTLAVLRTAQVFCKMSLSWNVSCVFLAIRLGFDILRRIWERKQGNMDTHSQHVHSGGCECGSVSGFSWNITLIAPFVHYSFWEEVTLCSPQRGTERGGELRSMSLKAKCLHKLAGALLCERILIFPHLFIPWFTGLSVDTCMFSLYAELQSDSKLYILLLILFQLWALGLRWLSRPSWTFLLSLSLFFF